MREVLRRWVADADTRQSLQEYSLQSEIAGLDYQDGRSFDLYVSLVGELFDMMRDPPADARDWATLGNALSGVARTLTGSAQLDATFFSAAAFYGGGYSASAYVAMQQVATQDTWSNDAYRACHDFLARPSRMASERVQTLLRALASGDVGSIDAAADDAQRAVASSLEVGPDQWIAERTYASLLDRFRVTNLRAVLPDGGSSRWDPLVGSLLNRGRPVWDFFPSQISAIQAGLLSSDEPFSMQMPTGAGKTALTETLLFNHLVERPDELAVLLVPYRALARELRGSLARRLTRIGIATRTVYGGTVPSYEEIQGVDELRAIVATPEALTGLLGSAPQLVARISLIVCDEGHLLDQPGRGVALELLLARLLGREGGPPRTVFVSAIVPNIEEINAWLGGSADSVVRSDFRPAEAEYAVLRPTGSGRSTRVGLQMQALDTTVPAHTLNDFLQDTDFRFRNETTGNLNTFQFGSVKTQAIAVARKSMALGTVAVFSATKTGDQGVVGLADELLRQLRSNVPLPRPLDSVNDRARLDSVGDYLTREYGPDWVGTAALTAGAVVHHGDIPQETREAVEELLSEGVVRMVLCTGTLAEGVNLPIRTLVLYAVQRRSRTGRPIPMLARDIRNLVGRAGRAGSSTKGLVICANPNQWSAVRPVAVGQPGEDVHGALRSLVEALQNSIQTGTRLTTQLLEGAAGLYPLTDGIDSTLIELLHDELGDEEFRQAAAALAGNTFAAQQLDQRGQTLLSTVFAMRATRLSDLRTRGRMPWIRETGARPRLVDSVVTDLVPSLDTWDSIESPVDESLLDAVLAWAYRQPDFQADLREAFPDEERVPPLNLPAQASLRDIVALWINGESFQDIALQTSRSVDEILRIYGKVISYSLATLVEQSIAVLQRYLVDTDVVIADAVAMLPEYLRFGVSTPAARALMASGLRHRRAAVLLGDHPAMIDIQNVLREPRDIAREVIEVESGWTETLGRFVYDRTRQDLGESSAGPAGPEGSRPDDPDRGDSGRDASNGSTETAGSGEEPGQRGEHVTGGDSDDPVQTGEAEEADGWSDYYFDATELEVIGHVRSLAGDVLDSSDAARVIRGLLDLELDERSIASVVAALGDVVVNSVGAAPTAFPLVESETVHEYDYGMRLDEVAVTFDAVLSVGLPSALIRQVGDALGGFVDYDDGERASIELAARLLCTAQVRVEFEDTELVEIEISLSDD